jgi:type IV secretion system protein VirB5
MNIKHFAVATLLSASASAFAVPVTVVADGPALMNQIQTMAQWAKQYQQMVGQLERMKQQYEALTGSRGLGLINNDPALRTYLPDEWGDIYKKVLKGDLKQLAARTKSIRKQEEFDPKLSGGRKRQLDVLASNKAITMQAYEAALARTKNIEALMAQINAAKDAKAAADLQNRMAAENAMIQNEHLRLSMLVQLQQAELRLADEQQDREFRAKHYR